MKRGSDSDQLHWHKFPAASTAKRSLYMEPMSLNFIRSPFCGKVCGGLLGCTTGGGLGGVVERVGLEMW